MLLNIVYLDDEKDLLELFVECYGSSEILIKTFSVVDEALKEVSLRPPDLFVVDYRLVGTTGDQVARQVPANIPRILITGELSVPCVQEFCRVFYKPYSLREMQEFLNSLRAAKAQAS